MGYNFNVLPSVLYLGHQPDALWSDVLDADFPPHELLLVSLNLLHSVRSNEQRRQPVDEAMEGEGGARLVAAAVVPNNGEQGLTNTPHTGMHNSAKISSR